MNYPDIGNDPEHPSSAVRSWLYFIVFLIFAMVLVGGATRLTDSGLSITEWKPIMGAIPPLSDADWQEALNKYRQIPQYQEVNKGMSMKAFQAIFWWEWAHRFLGRFIGIAFLIPFLIFWAMGKIPSRLKLPLLGLFILGGLQGFMGWYMVQSGLVDRIDVSQYRLAAHLGLALLIMGLVYWIALGLRSPRDYIVVIPIERQTVWFGYLMIVLVFLQFILGAFVAGLDAGKIYNTWPLMEDALIPSGLFEQQPWYLNLFENRLTVQFDHRMLAYILVGLGLIYVLMISRITDGKLQRSAWFFFLALLAQVVLGIATLLLVAPLHASLSHQALALIVFMLVIWHVHMLREARDQ